ncbi:hypothetical protein DERF_008238 [Dermatophagoides farinae]|uniref:Uncharacterized protein n=1 Tax=Dermatophagoides farinae TaxID=6954 RepID=A0A922I3Z9_DERFA|nr:hypothetical protein DERF_008238 [Dermatophagoides farinae]
MFSKKFGCLLAIVFIVVGNVYALLEVPVPVFGQSNLQPPEPGQRNFNGQSNPPEPGRRNFNGGNNYGSPSTDVVLPPNQYRKPDVGSPRTDVVLPNQGTSFVDSMQGDDPVALAQSSFQPPEPGRRNFNGGNNYGSPSTDVVLPPNQYRKPDLGSPRTDVVLPSNQYRKPDLGSPRTDVVLPNQGTSFLDSMQGDDPVVLAQSSFQPPEPGQRYFSGGNNYGSPRTDIVVPSNDQYRRPDLNSPRTDIVVPSNDQYRRPDLNSPRNDYVVPSNDQYRRPDLNSPRTDIVVPSNDQYRRPDLNSPRTDIVLPSNDQYRRPELNSPRNDYVVPSNDQYRRPDLNSPRTDGILPPNNQYRRPELGSPRTDVVVPSNQYNRRARSPVLDMMQGDDPNPIEPGQSNYYRQGDFSKPLEPGQPSLRPYGQSNVIDGVVVVPPAPNNQNNPFNTPRTDRVIPPNYDPNYDRPFDSPSTNPILPPNNPRPFDSPSTNPILPPNKPRPFDSPSTDPIRVVSYPGGLNSPSTDVVVPSLYPTNGPSNPPEPGRTNYFDHNRPHWSCDMTREDQCRLENRANFVQFKRGIAFNSPALVLDVTEAIRTRQSLPRLNPVKSYNAGRLVTRDYFPANNRVACLHFSYAWSGNEDKRMHLIQRNREDKCIFSAHTGSINDRNGEWRDVELQLDLSQGDSAFLIEFSFDIPNRENRYRRQTRIYPIDRINGGDSIIAVRDFKIGYGYCRNNQAFECDLPV